jgi:hypothetical protein
MKKWMSLQLSLELAKASFLRFPLVILSSILVTFLTIYSIENQENIDWIINLSQTALLGLPLFLAFNLYLQRIHLSTSKEWGILVIVLSLLAIYFYTLSSPLNVYDYIRFTLWIIGFHLLVSFAPYFLKREINGFWQFNQILFLRLLTSLLYSMVLFFGITIAIVAVDQLFNAEIDYKVYLKLWVFIIGIFNTWFFLSGIPQNFEELEQDDFYPSGLKLFTQFVLLPLVSIYFLILYVYGAKILFTWNLPHGWVTYLVLAFSGAGIFSLLLVYPIQKKEGYRWIRIYVRIFYIALFPLLALLFVSIGRRIYDYGMTEARYFVLVLALWLMGFSIYFLLSKVKNIQYIPMTLSFVILLSSFGPWGAFAVSESSQVSRLESILEKNKALKEGKLITNTKAKLEINDQDWESLTSIINYLAERDRLTSLQDYLDVKLDTLLKPELSLNQKESKITAFISKTFKNKDLEGFENENKSFFSQDESAVMEVKGYDYVIDFNMYNQSQETFELGKQSYQIHNDFEKNILSLKTKASSETIVSFDFNLLIQQLLKKSENGSNKVPKSEMTLIEQSQNYTAKLEILQLQVSLKSNGKNSYQSIRGKLFVRLE